MIGRPERQANGAVADMTETGALPRKSGELVFHHDWERRAFALSVALSEQGVYEWEEFRRQLIATIGASEASSEQPDLQAPGYFEHWLASLERLLDGKALLPGSSPETEESLPRSTQS